nr:hypothetical protein [Pedobacter sp. ASV2]
MNKDLRTALYIIGCLIAMYVVYNLFLLAMIMGNQRRPMVPLPNELKVLKLELNNELSKGGGYVVFDEIPQDVLKDCHAELKLSLDIYDDSISRKKVLVDRYVNSVATRVNQALTDKKCIDSIIVNVYAVYNKVTVDSLRYKNYHYSFPVR